MNITLNKNDQIEIRKLLYKLNFWINSNKGELKERILNNLYKSIFKNDLRETEDGDYEILTQDEIVEYGILTSKTIDNKTEVVLHLYE